MDFFSFFFLEMIILWIEGNRKSSAEASTILEIEKNFFFVNRSINAVPQKIICGVLQRSGFGTDNLLADFHFLGKRFAGQ